MAQTGGSRAVARRDAVTADPKHYRVEHENDRVRVLRASYGPHEKSAMHGHPDHVVIVLNNALARFTYPDGRTEDRQMTAGQTMYMSAEDHLPENVGDQPFEVIVIELKK